MPFISGAIAAVASAGSIGAAIVGGAGIAATVINTALSLALSVGASALAGAIGNKTAATAPGEIAATLQIGGDIPRQVAFGRVAIKGQLAFAATNGIANERLLQVFLLSDGWCDGLDAVWFGDVPHPLVPMTPDFGAVAKYYVNAYGDTGFGEKRATVWFYDGRPGQAANGLPHSYAPDRAEGTDRFAGMAYVMVELINNNDTFDGIPDLLWELRGYRCHDPRKDTAFGGAGSHDLSDPATWEYTVNPALHVLAYLRGIQSEGQVFMGLDLADYDVMTETFIDAANIADEAVPLDAGGSEARYTASAVLTAQDGDHRAAIAPLVQALAGYLIERNGSFGILAGAAQLPVADVTDEDIDWTRGVQWSGSKSRTDRVNEVHGQFVDIAAQWQANSYPPVTSSVFSAEDGERLAVSLDFGTITSPTQAQRAARIRMRETRRQATGSITLGMHMLWLEPGDWINWDSATFGFDKIYRIVSRDLNPDDTVTLQLQEVGNEIYSWSSGDEQPYVPAPSAPTEPPLPSTVTNLAVQPEVISGPDGSTRPVLRITWDPIDDFRVVAVIIEYRPIGTIAATRVRDDSPADGLFVLDQPPTGLEYEFRASISTVPARPVTWTSWLSLSALKPARFTVDVRDITARFRAQIDWQPILIPDLSTLVWNTAQSAESADGLAKASIRRVEQVNVSQDEARATLATEVAAKFGVNDAKILTVEEAVATSTSAVATLTTQVSANVSAVAAINATVTTQAAAIASNTGSIGTLSTQVAANSTGLSGLTGTVSTLSGTVTTQGTAITNIIANYALASYAVSIEAKANSISANGQIAMTAGAGPGGSTAQIKLRASATSGGTMVDAGLMMDVVGGVGRVSVFGAQFYFVDNSGANPISPLAYVGGQWEMNSTLVFRSGTTGARLEISSSVIRVYDASNVLRVRLGIW